MRAPLGCVTLQQAAKELKLAIGPNQLFLLLREQHILDARNRPYPRYLRRGYFETRDNTWVHPELGQQYYSRTFVTRRGLNWLREFTKRVHTKLPLHQPLKGS